MGLFLQVGFYLWAYQTCQPTIPRSTDGVIYYTGWGDPSTVLKPWVTGHGEPKLLLSGTGLSAAQIQKAYGISSDRVFVDNRAKTTDQNARYSTPMIKSIGMKDICLALPWYQMPRGLFLTRLYLLGSGVKVTPYMISLRPRYWFADRLFLWELVKFWGSIGRVALSWAGIEDWPPHFGYGSFDHPLTR